MVRLFLRRMLDWIGGTNRDYGKSWLHERKEAKAAGTAKPWYFGISLEHLRNAAGWASAAMLGGGISASTGDHSHHAMTYIFWYGGATLFVLAAIVLTGAVERRRVASNVPRLGPTYRTKGHELTGSPSESMGDVLKAAREQGLLRETAEGP